MITMYTIYKIITFIMTRKIMGGVTLLEIGIIATDLVKFELGWD